MHLPFSLWTAYLVISNIPTITAFYPYEPNYGDDNSNRKLRRAQAAPKHPSNDNRRSITLPIRRASSRRDNNYNIINSNEPKQKNAVAIDQDGEDKSYMVAVTIGDSKEEYHLLLDSAASNTWVMGQNCPTDACKMHNTFGKGDSGSLKVEDTTFSITYGTGTVSGTLASDTIHIGSLSPSVSFGLATNVSKEFVSYPMDGILGIGRGESAEGTVDIMDVLKTSNLIGAKLYGIHLNRAKDGLKDGELNFGEPNKDLYDDDLNYIPTVQNEAGFWEIKVDNVGVDGVELGIGGTTAVIDTGTSFILMPETDATSVHDLIPGYKKSGETYTVPCDTTKVIWIEFGGQKYNISTADYIGGKLASGDCASNIIGRQTFGEKQWLIGDVFLKNVYSVFDFDNSQVGFGVKNGAKEESPTGASSGTSSGASSGASTVSATSGALTSPTSASSVATGSNASPTGASTMGSQTSANPTAEAQAGKTSASASPTGAAAGVALSTDSFAFMITIALLAIFT